MEYIGKVPLHEDGDNGVQTESATDRQYYFVSLFTTISSEFSLQFPFDLDTACTRVADDSCGFHLPWFPFKRAKGSLALRTWNTLATLLQIFIRAPCQPWFMLAARALLPILCNWKDILWICNTVLFLCNKKLGLIVIVFICNYS